MSTIAVLPPTAQVIQLLAALLGFGVRATESRSDPSRDIVGVYLDVHGRITAACILDVSVGTSLGAALTRIPARAALELAERGSFDPVLAENLHEILNVACQLMRRSNGERVILGELYLPGQPLPVEVEAALSHPWASRTFEVTIGDYQPGRLSFLIIDGRNS